MSLVAIVLVHGLIVAVPLTRVIRVRSIINPRPCQCSFLGKSTIYSPRSGHSPRVATGRSES
jgi:hypothetical protein